MVGGKPKFLCDKPPLEPRSLPQIPRGLTTVSNPMFRGEWPSSKPRNYGTAVKVCAYKIPRRRILRSL